MNTCLARLALCAALAFPTVTFAEERKLTLGVYLPNSVDSRDKQFEFGQAFAAALGEKLGATISAKPFARHEDFTKAAASGLLDLAVSEALVLAQARGDFQAVAVGHAEGEGLARWAIVAERPSAVGRLKGKRLALVKGPGADADFVSNVVFAGDLPAGHFELVFVPAVESAVRAIEAGKADAALVPLAHAPKGLNVLYRSGKVTGAVLVALKGDAAGAKVAAAKLGAIAPFSSFTPASGDEVAQLRKRIARAPATRGPLVAESPVYRPDPSILSPYKSAGLSFPTFLEFVEVSKDHPDE